MRLEYPANIRIIRVPCSGKVDVRHLLRAIQKGADGVCVIGCLEGTCHYNEGNLRARERVEHVKTLLEEIGLEVAASAGAACHSDTVEISHVLEAMGVPAEIAQGSLTLTLGIENTREDVELALKALPPVVEKLRGISPLYADFMRRGKQSK